MYIVPIRTDATTQFTGALNVGDSESEAISLAPLDGLPQAPVIVRAITVSSVQNLVFDLTFFATSAMQNADPNVEALASRRSFIASIGTQSVTGGLYEYRAAPVNFDYPIIDRSGTESLYVTLTLKAGSPAKLANAAGALTITFWCSPMGSADV